MDVDVSVNNSGPWAGIVCKAASRRPFQQVFDLLDRMRFAHPMVVGGINGRVDVSIPRRGIIGDVRYRLNLVFFITDHHYPHRIWITRWIGFGFHLYQQCG
jgi:hypothetical protein